MVNFLTPPGLEGLFDLDAKGVDIRPTLLRVLTDQYLRNPVHSPEEEQRYTELAARLLDETDIATRTAVAARLGPHICAPRPIILQLARDVLEVAEPVLLHSPLLTPADCEAIIRERGACYADILAKRGKPASTPATAAGNKAPFNADTEAETKDEACELCDLFFAADSAERRLILFNLDFASWPAQGPPTPVPRSDVWRMETAALRHDTATLVRELERALGISHRQSRRIIEDDLGEPIVVAAKAMSMPADVLQRILLFMNPRVGQSVDRVYELSALYSEISTEAAQRLVTILRAADSAGRKPAPDTRTLFAAMRTGRRTVSEIAPARPHEAPRLRRGASGEG